MYFRYVDDTFVICRNEKESEEFLIRLNGLHSCLQFTFEKEKNNTLSFLDVHIGPAMAEAFLKWGGEGGSKSTTRFSSPTTRAGSGVARNFKRGGHNFSIFSSVSFSAELI